ncbi:hypothetical protein PTSG_07561 [Salpingoeca rosetta]|uniref:Glutathione S-transferase kappa n=1 Tax=Salpingoeca rosetta (strain ATCC 50818 / BSB-021) TaxID=946362 RepID=F2UH43_SALR5|nr:uncharacterized protein PTSG_07561 [Salpingoeca rosetta]EGD76442.1 hypothetical protein PTSG_07561 [Salpingoeca rosetta]|eukprot:XP_004991357.1 hypothetical protein PTSG_07561 [Salpingoeca rosetta]
MAGALKRLEFVYDVLSPYSYVAFELLKRYKPTWDVSVQYTPVAIGGLFKVSGNQSPAMIPLKGSHMPTDLMRYRKFEAVDINLPKDMFHVLFKKGSLRAQRLLTVCTMEHNQLVEPLTETLFQRVWRDDKDITEEASLIEALKTVDVPEDAASRMLERTLDSDVKTCLKDVTQNAVDRGVFGVPTFFIGDELVFGSDRFYHIARLLGEEYYGPFGAREPQDIQEILDAKAKL